MEQRGEIDMDETRKQFIEPEILKHDEKMADVTMQIGSEPDATIAE